MCSENMKFSFQHRAFYCYLVMTLWILFLVTAMYRYMGLRTEEADTMRRLPSRLPRGDIRLRRLRSKHCHPPDEITRGSEGAPSEESWRLRGVLAVTRHGDRGPLAHLRGGDALPCNTVPASAALHSYSEYVWNASAGGRAPWVQTPGPFHNFPTLPVSSEATSCALGQLTLLGVQQMLVTGEILKEAYAERLGWINSAEADPTKQTAVAGEVVAYTTRYRRTFQSALALLFALPPRAAFPARAAALRESHSISFCFRECACPRAARLQQRLSAEARARLDSQPAVAELVAAVSRIALAAHERPDADVLRDALLASVCHRAPLPCADAAAAPPRPRRAGPTDARASRAGAVVRRNLLERSECVVTNAIQNQGDTGRGRLERVRRDINERGEEVGPADGREARASLRRNLLEHSERVEYRGDAVRGRLEKARRDINQWGEEVGPTDGRATHSGAVMRRNLLKHSERVVTNENPNEISGAIISQGDTGRGRFEKARRDINERGEEIGPTDSGGIVRRNLLERFEHITINEKPHEISGAIQNRGDAVRGLLEKAIREINQGGEEIESTTKNIPTKAKLINFHKEVNETIEETLNNPRDKSQQKDTIVDSNLPELSSASTEHIQIPSEDFSLNKRDDLEVPTHLLDILKNTYHKATERRLMDIDIDTLNLELDYINNQLDFNNEIGRKARDIIERNEKSKPPLDFDAQMEKEKWSYYKQRYMENADPNYDDVVVVKKRLDSDFNFNLEKDNEFDDDAYQDATPQDNPRRECVRQEQLTSLFAFAEWNRKLNSKSVNHKKKATLNAYGLIHNVVKNMIRMISEHQPKLVYYSGHDKTIQALVSALGLSDYGHHSVYYASRMVFEVYRRAEPRSKRKAVAQDFYFRTVLNGKDVTDQLSFCRGWHNVAVPTETGRAFLCPIENIVRFIHDDYFAALNATNFKDACATH